MNSKNTDKFRLPPISAAAAGPLYQQIVDGIKREISEGRLGPGQPLPSFRALAEQVLVSLITVKRAYEELERDGIIYRKQGLGTFVSEDGAARSREVKRRQAEELLQEAITEGIEAGLTEKELLTMAKRLMRGPRGGGRHE
jgi:GntR family transcriptional regulator